MNIEKEIKKIKKRKLSLSLPLFEQCVKFLRRSHIL